MNKKVLFAGIAIAAVLMGMLSTVVLFGDMDDYKDKEPGSVQFTPDDSGDLDTDSLPYMLFEDYGAVLLVLAILMFGAIIGGAYIAKEDDEDDSD